MKKFLFFLLFFFLLSSVSAYTLICANETRGIQIWDSEQEFEETGWSLDVLGMEEGLNCTLVEGFALKKECKEYEPIINQLNQNLVDKHKEIQTLEKRLVKYNIYKWASYIFLVLSIVLIIFLKLNFKEEKNGNKKTR